MNNWVRQWNLRKIAEMMEVPEERVAVKAESNYDEAVEANVNEDSVAEEQEKEANCTYDTAARHRPGIHLSRGQESKVRHTENGVEVTDEASGFKVRNQQLQPGSELSDYDKDNQKVAALLTIRKITGSIPGCCMPNPCGPQDLLPGGKADGMPDSDFVPEDLAEGRTHEMEHTDDPRMATEIAKDHLAEDSMYYEKLPAIEKAAKNAAIDFLRDQIEKGANMDGWFPTFSTRMENCCEDKYSNPSLNEDTRHDEYGGDPGAGDEAQESQYHIRSQTTADQPTSNKYIPRESQQDVKSLSTPYSQDRQTIQNPVSQQPERGL